jgi:hypothetical protein
VIVLSDSEKAIVIVLICDGWEGENRRACRSIDSGCAVESETADGRFRDEDDDSIEVQFPRAGEVPGALRFCG